jgi:large subunit ribosomal protein LP0
MLLRFFRKKKKKGIYIAMATRTEKKKLFLQKFLGNLKNYPKVLLVCADHVGSSHMQDIRRDLRGIATLLMGKNTLIRRALRDPETLELAEPVEKDPTWETLLPHISENVGFVFTDSDLSDLKSRIEGNLRGAPAKPGVKSPCDVFVAKGPTGMDPTQTSFFQALNIATMISRGQIEIKQDVHLIVEGDKVGASEATLLQKLNIRPFNYGLKAVGVFEDGAFYDAKVLDITSERIFGAFTTSTRDIAAISLAIGFPTAASVPHSIVTAFKALLSISIETDYTFAQSEQIKAYLENPDAFVVAAPVAADGGADAADVGEEEEEESEADIGGGGLFGDDDGY